MSVTDLQGAQVRREYPFWRRDPEACTEEITRKGGQRIIAGIVSIRFQVLLIGGKIFCRRLCVVSVEGGDRKKWSDFHRYLQAGSMCTQSPVIQVIPVITAQDHLVAEEIVQPQAEGKLEAVGRQFFYRIRCVGKVYAVEREPEISMLFDQVQQESSLQARVDDLGKGERSGIGLTGAGAVIGMIPAA